VIIEEYFGRYFDDVYVLWMRRKRAGVKG